MKRLFIILSLVLPLFFLAGCIQAKINIEGSKAGESETTEKDDISGSVENDTDDEIDNKDPYAKPFPSDEAPKLYEPVYEGPLAYNDGVSYKVSFSPVPKADSYEIAFYAEGTDDYGREFAVRNTKGMGGNEHYAEDGTVSINCYFMQGVYTNNVTYRMKVRPVFYGNEYRRSDPRGYNWSNIWELKFTDGEGTASETEVDFDEEIAEAEAAEEARKKEELEAKGEDTEKEPPAETKYPLPHSFPEPLLEYLAREQGEEEPVSLSNLSKISVNVNHCEYGEPTQSITDEKALEQFKKAISEITVEGKEDEIFSTGTDTVYRAYDENGNCLLIFAIQDGLLEGYDGRYAVSGVSALSSIEGVMMAADWEAYYEDYNEMASEYKRAVSDSGLEGMPILDAAGYGTHLAGEADPEMLSDIWIYIDWNDEVEKLKTNDPVTVRAIFDALKKMKVKEKDNNAPGQMWHLYLFYKNLEHNFWDEAWLEFRGNCVEIGDYYYRLEGLEGLYDAVDCDVLNYLKENAETRPLPKIHPVY